MQISDKFNSNAFASNVFGTNSTSSIRDNKSSRSNDIFQGNPQSRTDRVSISSGAMNAFELELEKLMKKDEYVPEYDSNGVLIVEEVILSDSHLSLDEAVFNRVANGENWKHFAVSAEELATWSPQNRKLYEKLKKQDSEHIQKGGGLDPERTFEKLNILATYGGSRPMSDDILNNAVKAHDKGSEEFFRKNPDRVIGGGTHGDGPLMSQLFPDDEEDEEKIKEKLKKLEDELADRISSPSGSITNKAKVDTAQQDGSKNSPLEALNDLNKAKNIAQQIAEAHNAKIVTQQAPQNHNDMNRLEMQRMHNGLKHYEKASVSI